MPRRSITTAARQGSEAAEGAPHSFFDRDVAEHERAGSDAWARLQGFIQANR
jgi:dienelactone hydrolase